MFFSPFFWQRVEWRRGGRFTFGFVLNFKSCPFKIYHLLLQCFEAVVVSVQGYQTEAWYNRVWLDPSCAFLMEGDQLIVSLVTSLESFSANKLALWLMHSRNEK